MKNVLFALFLMLMASSTMLAQWSDNPAVNTQVCGLFSEQAIPKVAVGPGGDYYIGFFSNENQNYNVRLQRYDFQGNMLWVNNGIMVSTHPSMTWLTDWDMTVDHENHAILTWQDIRSGGNNNVVAYRISPEGEFVWGENGIMLSNSTNFDVAPKVTVTAENNAVFAWQSENNVIIQKLNPAGQKQWGENGITLSSADRYAWPQLMPVGNDEVILKFFEDSGPVNAPTRHILAQKFNASGNPEWIGNTVISNAGGIKAWTQILPMVNDGNDGFFISWHEDRNFTNRDSPYAQYVNANGQVQFQANGILLATDSQNNHFYTNLAKPANDEHVYIYWNKVNADQNQWGIFGQKLTPEGTKLWPDAGKELIPVTSNAVLPQTAISLEDEMVLLYEDYFNGIDTELKAMRIKNNGEMAWPSGSVTLSSVQSSKSHFDWAALHNDQMVFAWGDNRTGNADIYAQNLLGNGDLGPAPAPGYISGTLSFENGTADITLATITAGGSTTNPDPDGNYTLMLQEGNYTLTAEHPYTETLEVEDVEVNSGETTLLDMQLQVVRADLTVYAVNQDGEALSPVTVSIEGPEGVYDGTIENDYITFINVPYGNYAGSATFDIHTVDNETYIDMDNQEMTFVFPFTSLNPKWENTQLSVSPNPITPESLITIRSSEKAVCQVLLSDSKGAYVGSSKNRILQRGTNVLKVAEITDGILLTPGMYILHIIINNENTRVKLMVAR
jgi:hypothetical protein